MRSPPFEEKGDLETCGELTTAQPPYSWHPCTAQGEEAQHLRIILGPVEGDKWGQGILRFNFISHYPTLN